MEVNLVGEALKFMALGMGVVFTFLVIMIYALKAQAAIIGKFFQEEPKSSNNVQSRPGATDNKKNIVAAITAAIMHHNNHSTKG